MKIFITRNIPDSGIIKLRDKGYEIVINPYDRALTKEELIDVLKKGGFNAVIALLSDTIDGDVMDAAGAECKIFANYAVGFDNIDLKAAAERGIIITNTPGVLTNTVAEHAFALLLSVAHRIPESDRFTREGKYHGWEPMLLLGTDIMGSMLGIIGLGGIGTKVGEIASKGFGMNIVYHDIRRNEQFESACGAVFKENIDDVVQTADFVSLHVPLTPQTRHLMDARRLGLMKRSAYLINTSRGPVIDEAALVEVLRAGTIKGAALDVYENEPALAPGLVELSNVILTPHTASATEGTRQAMSSLAADNVITVLEGKPPLNQVTMK